MPSLVMSTVTVVAAPRVEDATSANSAVTVMSWASAPSTTVDGETEMAMPVSPSSKVRENSAASPSEDEPSTSTVSGPSVTVSGSTLNPRKVAEVEEDKALAGMVTVSAVP